jgi:hypothetical protein
MGESLLLLTIITLIVITIRRARPVILENPVNIHRPGQYHITLAPQLNRVQTFVEQIARQFIELHHPKGDLPTQYFEVRDPKVFSKGQSSYLLAISLRGGELYFQAANPTNFQSPCCSIILSPDRLTNRGRRVCVPQSRRLPRRCRSRWQNYRLRIRSGVLAGAHVREESAAR